MCNGYKCSFFHVSLIWEWKKFCKSPTSISVNWLIWIPGIAVIKNMTVMPNWKWLNRLHQKPLHDHVAPTTGRAKRGRQKEACSTKESCFCGASTYTGWGNSKVPSVFACQFSSFDCAGWHQKCNAGKVRAWIHVGCRNVGPSASNSTQGWS